MLYRILGSVISAGALLLIMIAALGSDAATRRQGNQVLQLTDGTKVNAVFDQQGRGFKVQLKDGTYKLSNGGVVRVQGGRIVWDAFGAIEKLRRGTAGPDPIG